jgi:hypothetical protein
MARPGDLRWACQPDTPKPFAGKGKSLARGRGSHLRLCASVQVRGQLTEWGNASKVSDVHQDTHKEFPSATLTCRLRARDGAMRKRRPGARSDRRRRHG